MGGWNDTMLGLKVKKTEEQLAQQLLKCLGVAPGEYGCEEVGRLSELFDPSVEGLVESALPGIMEPLDKHASDYLNQFYGDYCEDEDWEDEDCEEDAEAGDDSPAFTWQLDDLFHLVNKLFPSASVYLAHEEGNNTSDDYYRYEVILDAATGKKTVSDCFYSYGEGINVDGDDPTEEGTETRVEDIEARAVDAQMIDWLIGKAASNQYDELAKTLAQCK